MSQQFVNGTTQIFILELEVLDWLENIEPKTWDGMINNLQIQRKLTSLSCPKILHVLDQEFLTQLAMLPVRDHRCEDWQMHNRTMNVP